jgi:hypothetical protein
MLVSFGSEGCLLVPRSSSTSVAAWDWPTWVVSRRRVLQVVIILLESPSSSRRILSAPIHSPSLVCRMGPSHEMHPISSPAKKAHPTSMRLQYDIIGNGLYSPLPIRRRSVTNLSSLLPIGLTFVTGSI